eukprot:1812889-Pyramimonas_sp.AAC.1
MLCCALGKTPQAPAIILMALVPTSPGDRPAALLTANVWPFARWFRRSWGRHGESKAARH